MSLSKELIEALQELVGQEDGLRLINNYKGMPVVFHGTLIAVDEQGILVHVHPHQAVCLSIDGSTYITAQNLHAVFKASVSQIDFQSMQVRLEKFLFSSYTIGARVETRVKPAETVEVAISGKGSPIRGQLVDLSVVGVGVYTISADVHTLVTVRRGAKVKLSLFIDPKKPIRLPGEVLYVNKEEDVYRLGIRTEPDAQTMNQLTILIENRQAELLAELESVYRQKSTE